jgi:hypothetical protein
VLIKKIKVFLVQAISDVVSVAFRFMCRGELEEKEAMEDASKNIMLNIHSVFRETIRGFQDNPILKEKVGAEELKSSLILHVDNILSNILINLADSYPQAPASGGTPRMREAINEVNRVDDEENDFIFTSGIKIGDHLKMTEDKIDFDVIDDYTEFIMKVINSAIQVTQENKEDSRERTIFEKFTDFN